MTRRRIVDVLLVVGGVAVLAGGIGLRAADLRVETVLSGSMEPAVSAGDVVVTQPVPISELRVGDVIAFVPPDETRPVLHRITTISMEDGAVAVTTRGDANGVDDPWQATLRGSTAFRLVAAIPLLGWLAQYRGLVLLVAASIVAVLLIREIAREVRLRRPSQA